MRKKTALINHGRMGEAPIIEYNVINLGEIYKQTTLK
jgi:hypothetical protein